MAEVRATEFLSLKMPFFRLNEQFKYLMIRFFWNIENGFLRMRRRSVGLDDESCARN